MMTKEETLSLVGPSSSVGFALMSHISWQATVSMTSFITSTMIWWSQGAHPNTIQEAGRRENRAGRCQHKAAKMCSFSQGHLQSDPRGHLPPQSSCLEQRCPTEFTMLLEMLFFICTVQKGSHWPHVSTTGYLWLV